MNRTFTLICVLVLAIAVFTGCNPGSRTSSSTTLSDECRVTSPQPQVLEDAVKAFYGCLETKDPDKLLTLVTAEEAEKIEADPDEAGELGEFYSMAKVLKENDGSIVMTNWEITEGTSVGMEKVMNYAADADLSVGNERQQFRAVGEVTFVQSGDKWLIKSIKDTGVDLPEENEEVEKTDDTTRGKTIEKE